MTIESSQADRKAWLFLLYKINIFRENVVSVKKISILLCGIGIACALTGCGDTVPELTQEENDIITEYAVGLLLKYDKYHSSHLVDLTAYEEEQDSAKAEEIEEENNVEPEEILDEPSVDNAEVVDVSEEYSASSIEEFYGIEGFSFQYTGYELKNEYPEVAQDSAEAFFAMQATPGTQLLVLKFQAVNNSGMERELNMINCGMKSRVSVNGESSKSVLSTMLLNDIQTYKGTIEANASTELVAIVEVPEGTNVNNISIQLRSDDDSVQISLQ